MPFILSFLIALLSVWWIHPLLVKIALDKNIVDNPNARKLQRKPVPVLGGIAVFFAIFVSAAGRFTPRSKSTSIPSTITIALSTSIPMATISDPNETRCKVPSKR